MQRCPGGEHAGYDAQDAGAVNQFSRDRNVKAGQSDVQSRCGWAAAHATGTETDFTSLGLSVNIARCRDSGTSASGVFCRKSALSSV